mmetsp:Transcript_10570/g.25826  ORF Transcript_10570/g.25826 Transcript_10570/m.25826 type:complete len:502 (-) Transcript_10570:174-1679(-)
MPKDHYVRTDNAEVPAENFPLTSSLNFEHPTNLALAQIEDRGDVKLSGVVINMIKCAVGAGSFSFPFAFTQTGIVGGIISLILFAVMAGYTMRLLADSEKRFVLEKCQSRLASFQAELDSVRIPRLTYPELMREAFPNAKIFGNNYMVGFLYAMIIFTSVGVSVAYVLFILSTLNHGFGWDTSYIILVITAPLLILALIQSFKLLKFTSILGDVAVVAGLVGTIAGGLAHRTLSWPTNIPAFNSSSDGSVPTGIATLCFMFTIHMLCLPMAQSLEGDLAHPKNFRKSVNISFTVIMLLNLAFTLICVCIFAEDSEGIMNPIVKNLSKGKALQAVRMLLCLDLLFTVPMVLAVGREIVEGSIFSAFGMRDVQLNLSSPDHLDYKGEKSVEDDVKVESTEPAIPWKQELTRVIVRACLVGLILTIAAGAVENSGVNQAFQDVVALIGGFSGSLLGFIIPPILYWRSNPNISVMEKAVFVTIVTIGWGLLGSTTYYTIKSMAHA